MVSGEGEAWGVWAWGVGRCTAAMHGSRTCLRPDPRLEIARVVPLMLHWSRPVWMYAKSVPKPLAISLPELMKL